ncbi:MAG: hypothetical protein ABIE74_10060 [Pseudomonadota bacterium]
MAVNNKKIGKATDLPQFKWFRCNRTTNANRPKRVSISSSFLLKLHDKPIFKGIIKWWMHNHACTQNFRGIDLITIHSIDLKSGSIFISGEFRYAGTDRIGFDKSLWLYATTVTPLNISILNKNSDIEISNLVKKIEKRTGSTQKISEKELKLLYNNLKAKLAQSKGKIRPSTSLSAEVLLVTLEDRLPIKNLDLTMQLSPELSENMKTLPHNPTL